MTKFQRLKWNKAKNEVYYACALSVYGNSRYKVFLKHLLVDSDALSSNTKGKVTFVYQSMKVGIPNVQAQYGKAIFQQQQFVQNHERTIIHNVSSVDMAFLKLKLQDVPAVQALHQTYNSTHDGTWYLLTETNIPNSSLQLIDDILTQH